MNNRIDQKTKLNFERISPYRRRNPRRWKKVVVGKQLEGGEQCCDTVTENL